MHFVVSSYCVSNVGIDRCLGYKDSDKVVYKRFKGRLTVRDIRPLKKLLQARWQIIHTLK